MQTIHYTEESSDRSHKMRTVKMDESDLASQRLPSIRFMEGGQYSAYFNLRVLAGTAGSGYPWVEDASIKKGDCNNGKAV